MNPIAEAVLDRESPTDVPADRTQELRAGIDEIDRALVELLFDRCRLARALGRIKRDEDRSLVDHPREAEVVRSAAARARERGLDEEMIRRLFWGVIELSRRTQRDAEREVEG